MNFKKIIAVTNAMCLSAVLLAGCSSSNTEVSENSVNDSKTVQKTETQVSEDTADSSSSEPYSVVCTIFPEYDWVKEIIGSHADNAEITYLLDNGADLHSYQPTANDMIKISDCDLFIYVGGESDEWVEDVLAEAKNPDMQVVNLLEEMGEDAKEEEHKEGMQEEEEEHEHSHSVSDFDDADVKDRPLSDWEGDWQSAYPLVLDGSLDEAWEHKAEGGDMTAEEYKEYYTKGYKSDYSAISIHGNHISFTDNSGKTTESDYKYTGYFIQNWSTGTKGAMYRFEAEDKESGAPVYIEFNDHIIEPVKSDHFHIRMSNESYDAIIDPENNWPTFFGADLSPEEVCEEVAGHGEHEAETDEHVWLSLKNAQKLCTAIESKIEEIDPANAADYKANLDSYIGNLSKLDKEYEETIKSSSVKTLLFGDRFPFRYLTDDYGLDYYAAFAGCSAETEASFETVVFLAEKVDELGLKTVFTIENSDQKIAKTVVDNSKAKDAEIMVLNSVQSVTLKDGATYLGLMTENLETLKKALS